MAKKNFYAVKVGRKPGIYKAWEECSAQVAGFVGAKYRGFTSLEDTEAFLKDDGEADKISRPNVDNLTGLRKVFIYTDGTTIGNPGLGGYATVLIYGNHRKEISGGVRLTTSSRMELMAALVGLGRLKIKCSVTLYSDSKYLADSIQLGWAENWRAHGWRKKDGNVIANIDLWKQLLQQCDKHDVTVEWIAGHEGNRENERCDELARQALADDHLPPDWGFEKKFEEIDEEWDMDSEFLNENDPPNW